MSTDPDEDKMDTRRIKEHRIMVIGKSGNGKSSLCNTLCGRQLFETGRGLAVTTRTAQHQDVHRHGYQIRVVDTPDVTNINMNTREMEEEVSRWRQFTHPYPTVVLLVVRCDVRYTGEEHAIYRQIQMLWGDNSLKEHLVVAFTFGDRQDNDLEDELRTVCPELKGVLRDASQRYVLFTNKGPAREREAQVQLLLTMAERGHDSSMTKYLCAPLAQWCALAMGLVCFMFRLCLCDAPLWVANKAGSTILFLLKCLMAVVLWIMEKIRG